MPGLHNPRAHELTEDRYGNLGLVSALMSHGVLVSPDDIVDAVELSPLEESLSREGYLVVRFPDQEVTVSQHELEERHLDDSWLNDPDAEERVPLPFEERLKSLADCQEKRVIESHLGQFPLAGDGQDFHTFATSEARRTLH